MWFMVECGLGVAGEGGRCVERVRGVGVVGVSGPDRAEPDRTGSAEHDNKPITFNMFVCQHFNNTLIVMPTF